MGNRKFGSTLRGISPAYADRYMKKALRLEDLLHPETLKEKVEELVEWKNLTIEKGYGWEPVSTADTLAWLDRYGAPILSYIQNTTDYLSKAIREKKSILFEAQLGALRDIDYGIYPYTSASSTLAAYATLGAGIPFAHLDETIGIMKAYSTCVGEGPFVCEMFGEEGNLLREAGGEYGAATGRPRRVGPFDAVASRYGVQMQGSTYLALTKLDVLSYMEEIPICVAYEIDGKKVDVFPGSCEELNRAKPVYEYLPGFCCDISGCHTLDDLPSAAKNYIRVLEDLVSCPIRYVSVGAERNACIRLF